VEPAVQSALEAIDRRDWDRLRPLLHPYIRWTGVHGEQLRGRLNVMAMLASSPVPPTPSECELRDGQIYRWVQA
jgi:hypothetical protein